MMTKGCLPTAMFATSIFRVIYPRVGTCLTTVVTLVDWCKVASIDHHRLSLLSLVTETCSTLKGQPNEDFKGT